MVRHHRLCGVERSAQSVGGLAPTKVPESFCGFYRVFFRFTRSAGESVGDRHGAVTAMVGVECL